MMGKYQLLRFYVLCLNHQQDEIDVDIRGDGNLDFGTPTSLFDDTGVNKEETSLSFITFQSDFKKG